MANMTSPNLVPVATGLTTTSTLSGLPGPPADRNDIHKSCRTIETLVSTLTDYCETARAFASIQKKLAKALKEAAGLKAGVEYAANALAAAANIFEVLAEVDSKFAKIADKECGGVSAEVKKWLKKLAKEEKAYDDRMNESNTKIKQAGQTYEKKSKKGGRDASEEHTRYINLLSVIGPEMSQEKHNHAMFVAQQHASTMFGVAASLSRIADAEWARACESMRRFAPTIGPLGEWKVLCEGAWSGPLPADLPDSPGMSNAPQAPFLTPQYLSPISTITTASGAILSTPVSEWGSTAMPIPTSRSLPVPPGGGGFRPGSAPPSAGMPLALPCSAYPSTIDTNTHTGATSSRSLGSSERNQGSINSVTTLSAFPLPPTHIPIPLSLPVTPASDGEMQKQQAFQVQRMQRIQAQTTETSLSQTEIQTRVQGEHNQSAFSEPPIQMGLAMDVGVIGDLTAPSSSSHVQDDPIVLAVTAGDPLRQRRRSIVTRIPPPLPSAALKGPLPPPPVPTILSSTLGPESELRYPRVERVEQVEVEFGAQQGSNEGDSGISSSTGGSSRSAFKHQSTNVSSKSLERNGSIESNVAALRNRYSRVIDSPAQGLKDIPRLRMSVSEMASRYQPVDEQMSPRRTTVSPSVDRFPPSETSSRPAIRDPQINESEVRRRKQRMEELAELDLKEKEHESRQRERKVNPLSPEVDKDKLQFLHSPPELSTNTSAIVGDVPRGPRNSPFFHKRGSQSVSHITLPHSSSSSSVTTASTAAMASASVSHIPLPTPTPLPYSATRIAHTPSRSQTSTPLPPKDHAPFCGCDTCSVSKYRLTNDSPIPSGFRSPKQPIVLRPEKPKGWMRRLSLPSVNAAFLLDATKKNTMNLPSSKQALPIPVGENGRLKKRSFEQVAARVMPGRK